VTGEKCEVSSAREAADALREVISRARAGVTVDQESGEALAELARVAELLGRTVEGVAGEAGGEVCATADALARTIAARGSAAD
jgi:hypothetical protein